MIVTSLHVADPAALPQLHGKVRMVHIPEAIARQLENEFRGRASLEDVVRAVLEAFVSAPRP